MGRRSKNELPQQRFLKSGNLVIHLRSPEQTGPGELIVLDAREQQLAHLPVALVSAGREAYELGLSDANPEATPIVMYPGARRDPLGRASPISWINGEGRGVIHAVHQGHLVHLELDGAVSRYTSMTRSTPSGFLLCAFALALPANITGPRLCELTRFSSYTVWRWLEALERDSWIAPVAIDSRSQSYALTESGISRCAEQVEAGWKLWRADARLGRGIPPAQRHYFLSLADSQAYELAVGDDLLIFTGIESLFRDGDLMRMGSVRETAFITTPTGLSRITDKIRLSLHAQRDFAGASEVTIVPPTHPFSALVAYRRRSNFTPAWPAGFGALDAIDHPDARVADVARSQWERWIGTVRSHVTRIGSPRA